MVSDMNTKEPVDLLVLENNVYIKQNKQKLKPVYLYISIIHWKSKRCAIK